MPLDGHSEDRYHFHNDDPTAEVAKASVMAPLGSSEENGDHDDYYVGPNSSATLVMTRVAVMSWLASVTIKRTSL